NFAAIAAGTGGRDVELAERMRGVERADIFKIPAGAEGAAGAIEHRDRRVLVGVELQKRLGQRVGARRVHGVARLRPIVDHGPDRSVLLNSDGHWWISSSSCLR